MRLKLSAILACALALFTLPAAAMDVGTNFWNLGWHNPADCFQDVKNVSGENPWNPQFLKEIAVYSSLRFMDWDNTNGSTRSEWSQRPAKDAKKQNPVAYEWMIDLCNRNNSDMWVTLPHLTVTPEMDKVPSDYALRLCILVKTGVDMKQVDLKPLEAKLAKMTAAEFVKAGGEKSCAPLKENLRLYVEYSNETWNGMFKQAHYCWDTGEKMQLDTKNRWYAGFKYHAWAAIRLFRAADLVFGADSKRIVKVLATQQGATNISRMHLEVLADPKLNPWGVTAHAIAAAPYFGNGLDGDDKEIVAKLRDAITKSAERSAKLKELADKAKLRLICYEGGQHVIKQSNKINREQVMYDLYLEYLKEMSKYYDHFCHYAHVGKSNPGGSWGCIESTGQPIADAPKYRALVEWSKKNNNSNDSNSSNKKRR